MKLLSYLIRKGTIIESLTTPSTIFMNRAVEAFEQEIYEILQIIVI